LTFFPVLGGGGERSYGRDRDEGDRGDSRNYGDMNRGYGGERRGRGGYGGGRGYGNRDRQSGGGGDRDRSAY
jgi:hypothetical protein